MRALVLTSIVIAILTGCSTAKTNNTGSAITSTGLDNVPTISSKLTVSKAPRPKELKLAGIDPCTVYTAAQRSEIKIDEVQSKPLDVLNSGNPTPICRYHSNGISLFSYNVALVTEAGIEYWKGGSNLDVDLKSVSGFTAYQLKLSGTSDAYCSYTVDVADGEQLYVQFFPIGDGFTQDQMCQNAAKGAELALATLQNLK